MGIPGLAFETWDTMNPDLLLSLILHPLDP
jgi:hypothetical protein